MNKYALIAIGFALMALETTAQTHEDALRFSNYEFGGTARYNAMAGAFGALGGDVSVLATNPAGLGLFRSSDLMITPTFAVNGADAKYYGTSTDDSRFNFNLNNIGLVVAYETNKDKWKNAQFGFSYARLQDFQNNYTISGETSRSSFLTPIAEGLTAIGGVYPQNLDQGNFGFVEFPAWETYLLEVDTSIAGQANYDPLVPFGTNVEQVVDLQTRGKIGETNIGGSINYDDRLYLGVSLGFQRIVYRRDYIYTEKMIDGDVQSPSLQDAQLHEFSYVEQVETSGNGMNVKLGAIYKATDNVRIGASYQSPTWSTLSQEVDTEMNSLFEGQNSFSQPSAQIALNTFNMSSPHRLTGSLGIVLGKKGIISADYEYLDYTNTRLRSSNQNPGTDYRASNERSELQFQDAANIRIGGEYRLNPFSLRLGTALYGNPNKSQFVESNGAKMFYTAGIGYRSDRTYIDVSYRLRSYSDDVYLYNPDYIDPAIIDHSDHSYLGDSGREILNSPFANKKRSDALHRTFFLLEFSIDQSAASSVS